MQEQGPQKTKLETLMEERQNLLAKKERAETKKTEAPVAPTTSAPAKTEPAVPVAPVLAPKETPPAREIVEPKPEVKTTHKVGEIVKTPEILDGKEAKDLAESMHVFELKSGDIVYAGTDKGINYADHNEDRVTVNPKENFFAVVDGMGGESKGELAAQILAEEFLTESTNIDFAVNQAKLRMSEQGVEGGGAVFISAQLNIGPNGKFLNISQLGDAKLIIIKKDGTVRFESKDESLVQTLVDGKVITPDEALYNSQRNVVTKAVSPDTEDKVKSYPLIKVENGDMVLLYSDGISDNFTPEEIAKKIKEGLSGKALFSWLSDATGKRMQNAKEIVGNSDRENKGVYSDGYKSKPKPDNRSLVIVEIKNDKIVPALKLEGPFTAEQMREQARATEKAQALATLRETITNATRELAEIQRELAEIRAKKKETGEKTPEIKTFSTELIQKIIIEMLESFEKVTEVKSVEVGSRDNKMSLAIKIRSEEKVIGLKTIVEYKNGEFVAESPSIDAGMVTRMYLRSRISPWLDKIGEILKGEVEKLEGKKVKKVWFEDGQLKATF
ncbi:MAG: hypothetical protein WAN61_03530 [Minisyncoccia bacterium]